MEGDLCKKLFSRMKIWIAFHRSICLIVFWNDSKMLENVNIIWNTKNSNEIRMCFASIANTESGICIENKRVPLPRHGLKAQHSRLNWFRWYNGGTHFCLEVTMTENMTIQSLDSALNVTKQHDGVRTISILRSPVNSLPPPPKKASDAFVLSIW